LTLLHDLPDIHPGTAMVLDLGSTKSQIMGAMQNLPERFDPLGGHPMCGKERLSLANAEPGLFTGAPFAFSALPRTSARARLLAEQLAVAIGAQPLWLDPETHDRWTAATSHLPYLVANTLAGATPLEARPMVGSGLRSTTRLAGTPLHMMADILVTNRENILQGVKHYRENLRALEDSLETGDFDALWALLEQGQANYELLTGQRGDL
jgi:prephenate dehydrogenase